MTDIKLTTTEIFDVSSQLTSKAEEISGATAAANGQVARIREMVSPRLKRNIETWDKLKDSIDQAVEALREASKELQAIGQANEDANR